MNTLIGLVLALIAHGALAQSAELHVVQDGSRRAVNDDQVIAELTALVESSSVDSTSYVRPAEQWEEALAAPIFIHALFEPSRQMRVRRNNGNDPVSPSAVREVVVVFPSGSWPTHIFVKTNGEVRSVTKYSPCVAEKLIEAAKLVTTINTLHRRSVCGRTALRRSSI